MDPEPFCPSASHNPQGLNSCPNGRFQMGHSALHCHQLVRWALKTLRDQKTSHLPAPPKPGTPVGSSDLLPVSLGEMAFRHSESKPAKNYTADDPSVFQKSKVTSCHSLQPYSDQSGACQLSQHPKAHISWDSTGIDRELEECILPGKDLVLQQHQCDLFLSQKHVDTPVSLKI